MTLSLLGQVEQVVDSLNVLNPPAQSLDTIPPSALDSGLQVLQDTLAVSIDSSGNDLSQITFSKDSLDAPVDYSAVDSMIYDIANQQIHLFGQAEVSYTTISLKADHIVLN